MIQFDIRICSFYRHTTKTDDETLSNHDEFRSPCSTPTKTLKIDHENPSDDYNAPTKVNRFH